MEIFEIVKAILALPSVELVYLFLLKIIFDYFKSKIENVIKSILDKFIIKLLEIDAFFKEAENRYLEYEKKISPLTDNPGYI
jgi:hypothetical protein